jgi:hypothetical protein
MDYYEFDDYEPRNKKKELSNEEIKEKLGILTIKKRKII